MEGENQKAIITTLVKKAHAISKINYDRLRSNEQVYWNYADDLIVCANDMKIENSLAIQCSLLLPSVLKQQITLKAIALEFNHVTANIVHALLNLKSFYTKEEHDRVIAKFMNADESVQIAWALYTMMQLKHLKRLVCASSSRPSDILYLAHVFLMAYAPTFPENIRVEMNKMINGFVEMPVEINGKEFAWTPAMAQQIINTNYNFDANKNE